MAAKNWSDLPESDPRAEVRHQTDDECCRGHQGHGRRTGHVTLVEARLWQEAWQGRRHHGRSTWRRPASKLHPDVQERLSNSPAIVNIVRGMAERDAEFAARHGLKQRPDIQNLREVMSQPRWQKRLADMLQAGNVPLPGIAVLPAGAAAVYDTLSDR